MNKHKTLCLCLFILIFNLSSCASSLIMCRGEYLKAYHQGGIETAESQLNQMVNKNIPDRNYTKCPDSTWILLDRATTRFALGKTNEAIRDYEKALESLDYYHQDLPSEQFSKVFLEDASGAYQGDGFEHMLAKVYMALALLHQGDDNNAYALLRQAEEYQQKRKLAHCHICQENPLSKYLFATLLEKHKDFSNAEILYREAAQLLGKKVSTGKHGKATVLVICHNGNSPYKVTTYSDASVASALALECLLGAAGHDPALSSLTGIPVPCLRYWPWSSPARTIASVDQTSQCLESFYDIGKAAELELDQKMPVIVARGVARFALRRTAVGYANQQDEALGFLTDLACLAANVNTKADTRSWTTLPRTIDLARFEISPGEHSLTIQVDSYPFKNLQQTFQLSLKSDDLCVINIFNIHPGITRILIPPQFLFSN